MSSIFRVHRWFSAEFKWISPRPRARDAVGHNKDGDSRHAIPKKIY